MSLAVAEPFVAPVDLQQYPAYARVVPYPVDLATIRYHLRHRCEDAERIFDDLRPGFVFEVVGFTIYNTHKPSGLINMTF